MTEEQNLADLIWSARSTVDVEEILRLVPHKTIPVGRENNIGTIRMASDPGLALIERVTNGIDSILELAVEMDPNSHPKTPQEAALLAGVPETGLQDMTETERRKLAERLLISIHDSGAKRSPTIRVTDNGVGQHPSMFSKTLLSLNETNKVGKPYTLGTYGQGGSVTFGFSKYTVILSRRHPQMLENGQDDIVGWTIVYEEETDPTKNVLPRYVWIVGQNGEPLSFPHERYPELTNGARITHVEYDVQNLQGPFTTQMWQFLHAALFEPVLPFVVTGDRSNDPKKTDGSPDSRVVIGNAARLANTGRARGDIKLGAYDSHLINLGEEYGSVTASWWVLVRPDESKSKTDPAASYVDAKSAVSLTLHGQRQDTEPRAWIKDKAKMPFLYKNMVVHINANELRPAGRRELFASTRERATESELRKLIYERVSDLIRSDADLRSLNHSEKERLLKRSTAATNEKIRKRLGKFIKTKLAGRFKPTQEGKKQDTKSGSQAGAFSGSGQESSWGGTERRSGGRGGGRNTDDTRLHHVPTALTFESKRMRIPQGRGSYVWVDINAKNRYLPRHDDDLTIQIAGPEGHLVVLSSRSVLLGGKTRWSFLAPLDTPLGEQTLYVTLRTAGGDLSAELPIEIVVPPPEPSRPRGGIDEETGPDVRWISKPDWDDDWRADVVGKVTQDDESTIIFVNRDYDLLAKALASSSLTQEQITTRAERYQLPVACGLWLQNYETSNMDSPPSDEYLKGELNRLAEAVLVAMDPDVELARDETSD